MSLKASMFDWNGKNGTISLEAFKEACVHPHPDAFEVESDKTGRKMIFQSVSSSSYISVEAVSGICLSIFILDQRFPFKLGTDISGKYFILTGNLRKPTEAVADMITALGGRVHTEITKDINYVIQGIDSNYLIDGDATGKSKVIIARLKGIPIIDGNTFVDYLDRVY